jgi:ubiquinone/menaquinone biosynthesis C-methylase UbiE
MNILLIYLYNIQLFAHTTKGWITMCKPISFPKVWNLLSSNLKEHARSSFIKRAENIGVPWSEYVERYKGTFTSRELEYYKSRIEDLSIYYPNYYLQPFHGYDEGNLEWKAAVEAEAATITVSANYWKNTHYQHAENWLRQNASNNIITYLMKYNRGCCPVNEILDIGCSIGVSSEFLAKTFPRSNVTGLDLSPYFLSVASYRAQRQSNRIQYIHANAEAIPFDNDSISIITVNFMFHEVPNYARESIFQEIYRVLKPYGLLIILDLDPDRISSHLSLNPFRKWAFEITEPHISDYYQHRVIDTFYSTGFDHIETYQNDPVNRIWIGQKSLADLKLLDSKHMYDFLRKADQQPRLATTFSTYK